jgi:hypothetical protein
MIRRVAIALAVAVAIGTAGCASTAYHAPYRPSTRHTLYQGGWCAFHAWRFVHDIRTHHKGWAAFQAILTFHHCKAALRGL